MSVKILLLEDSAFDAELITEHLSSGPVPFEIDTVVIQSEFAAALATGRHDLILSDYALPAFDGLGALEMARRLAPDVPFIFVSGMFGEETAIETLKRGATDYVLKQRLNRLPAAVSRALQEAEAKRERRRAEERTRLLVAELSHRVKNTLATVVAIARQTIQKAESLEDFRTVFMGRLETLAEAHALLFRADWSHLDIRDVLAAALGPFSAARDAFRIAGEPAEIPPSQALTLNLIVHELATNACKYGALSVASGRVEISWSVGQSDDKPCAFFEWREIGGPPVRPPKSRGFGATLIERAIAYEFDGESRLDFQPDGLVCRLCLPLEPAGSVLDAAQGG